ncbi:hypothetical protein RCL1_007475 [Eukaryota sp. TZLM3-RCL]
MNILGQYRGRYECKMVNRHNTIVSFARNLCEQLFRLPHWSQSRSLSNPSVNAIIGTRGSGKTTFGCCFLQNLVDSPELSRELRDCVQSSGIDPRLVDLLIFLYLSGRWFGVELPTADDLKGSAEEFFLSYVASFFDVQRREHVVVNFTSDLQDLFSKIPTKRVDSDLCCFSTVEEALRFYQETTNSRPSSLPLIIFCDEVSLVDGTDDKCVPKSEMDMITDFFPIFKKIVRSSLALVYVAGLYRQYIERRLTNSKFEVVTYRLPAIVALSHLREFLLNDSQLQECGYNEFDALSCLIRCAGNPRLIVNVIEDYKNLNRLGCHKPWTVNVSLSATSSSPILQALALASVPLLLGSNHGRSDVLDLLSRKESLDVIELQSNLMLSPLVTPPPRNVRPIIKYQPTRFHCLLNTFDLENSYLQSSSSLRQEISRAFQQLIQDTVHLFTLGPTNDNYSHDAGKKAELLVVHLLLLRNYLVRKYVQMSGNLLSLVYFFGPSHTCPDPDTAEWIHHDYAIELRQSLAFSLLPGGLEVREKKRPETLNCDNYRGRICLNKKNTMGPDIVLIPLQGNTFVGVDCKVKMSNEPMDAAKQFAKQFVQCLASDPPVPVLFSIRCTNDAVDVFRIKQYLSLQVYEEAFHTLKIKHPLAFLDTDTSFSALQARVEDVTGVLPVHELCGNQFFGPILGSVLKTYYDLLPDHS